MKAICSIMALAVVLVMTGCGSGTGEGDTSTLKKADAETIQKTQPGANGSKAAHGGGMADMDIVPAKAGEKTGLPDPGPKAGN
jgi:ABC-type phosphate transport system substrate-binding protein